MSKLIVKRKKEIIGWCILGVIIFLIAGIFGGNPTADNVGLIILALLYGIFWLVVWSICIILALATLNFILRVLF